MREGRQGRENAQCLDEYPLGKKECTKKYTRIKQYVKRLQTSDESYQDGRSNQNTNNEKENKNKQRKKKYKLSSSSFPHNKLHQQTERSIRKMKIKRKLIAFR